MAKFATIAKGTAAEKPVKVGAVECVMRPLDAGEELDVVAEAIRIAKGKGSPPEPKHAVYDAAIMAATLAMACLDSESPEGAREPYFAGAAEVFRLDPDVMALVYEQHALWQAECSPAYRKADIGQLFDIAKGLGDEEAGPFLYEQLPRTTQKVSALFMAALLRTSHAFKSSSGSSSEPPTGTPPNGGPSTSSSAPKKSKPERAPAASS